MLTSALEHYRRQQVITAAGLIAARKARRKGGAREAAKVVALYQLAAARDAANAIPRMLDEQGIEADPAGAVVYTSLAGVASDGRPLDTLFDQASNDYAFGLMVVTQLQDVARIAAGIGIVSRPRVTGYARMLNPPSCSRCAILAGKFFKWNAGFERHPRCDCRHVPSSEALAGDLTADPNAYFKSLDPATQERIFTKKGAEAIRDGADPAAVVNARRGMSAAGTSRTTTRVIDGETFVVNVNRRTLSGSRLPGSGDGAVGPAPTDGPDLLGFLRESRPTTSPGRMTPEGIYEAAKDRAEAIALLRANGYIT